jgi:hypothetical protein
VLFHVSADNVVLDACLEDAPTKEMAEAALEAAGKLTFTPATLDGKPVGNRFYYSIWFRSSADDTSSPGDIAEKQPGSGDTARSTIPSGTEARGVYRSEEPSFAFGYPAGFEQIPRGELEEERRSATGPHHYGFEPGSECNTLLFRAQRLRPGERVPEFVSIIDLAPMCVFGALDQKALEATAVSAARSVVAQWGDVSVSKPKRYMVNGRNFVVVASSGIEHRAVAEQHNVLVVMTIIRYHAVAWTIMGPDANHLAQTLADCTLQVGEAREGPLLPLSEKP